MRYNFLTLQDIDQNPVYIEEEYRTALNHIQTEHKVHHVEIEVKTTTNEVKTLICEVETAVELETVGHKNEAQTENEVHYIERDLLNAGKDVDGYISSDESEHYEMACTTCIEVQNLKPSVNTKEVDIELGENLLNSPNVIPGQIKRASGK